MQWRGDLWRNLTIVAKFWISSIFLDRHGHLHCQTMKEKYGLPFCSWVQSCTGKSCLSVRVTFCWDPEILLLRQRDVTTSPLYVITNHCRQDISPLNLSMFAVCKLVGVDFNWNLANWGWKLSSFPSFQGQEKKVFYIIEAVVKLPNVVVVTNFQARSCNTLDTFRAVIEWRGPGISPDYFHRKIEEKWNQKKS